MSAREKTTVPAVRIDNSALVAPSALSKKFADYALARDIWLDSPIAHNRSLATTGAVFTILDAVLRFMPATDLDKESDKNENEDVQKICYLCRSQEDWDHEDADHPENSVHYPKGNMFVIMFKPYSIRLMDLERIQGLLSEAAAEGAVGSIENVRMDMVPNKRAGFSATHKLVSAEQWGKNRG